MRILETIVVAFSLFSALPMPAVEWNGENRKYSLCAFPLIGAVIGLCCWLWIRLCLRLEIPSLLRGAVLCALPVLITGGIHLDGFADTWDALSSHAAPERKREILKDPHAGAFAVIHLCLYFLLSFALWTSVQEERLLPLVLLFCLSRALSGLALTLFPLAPGSGLARSFAEAADQKRVRVILALLSLGLALGLILCGAWAAVPTAALVFAAYYRLCVRQFEGLSGDLAGWFLQTAELWMLAALLL